MSNLSFFLQRLFIPDCYPLGMKIPVPLVRCGNRNKLPVPFAVGLLLGLLASVEAAPLRLSMADSTLGVDAKASPGQNFTSMAQQFEARVDLDPETLEVREAVCSFHFADLDSEEAKRDQKMLRWMESEAYPDGAFTLKEVRRNGDQWVGTGTFTMHGQSREIEVPFTVERDGDKVILDGQAEMDTREWGLPKIRLFIFTVQTVIRPHFHLEGTFDLPRP